MNKVTAKTILRSYKSLFSIAEQIDDLVLKRAMSTHSLKTDCVLCCAEKQVEQVVKLMNKKNNLINLKLLTDETLEALGEECRTVLKNKYIECLKPEETAKSLGISLRTYFRRLDKAEKSFAKELLRRGCDDEWFKENYFDQSWLKYLYENTLEKVEKQEA